jgi:phage shock protein E
MKSILIPVLVLAGSTLHAADPKIPNPLIDYPGFQKAVADVSTIREKRRVTEEKFIRMAAEPGTIVFDARSDAMFARLHVQGAKHLSLPDVTAELLAKLIPDKSTRILIYCNNNFLNEPAAFPGKCATASLNIYTFNTLHSYGYDNVYELGPLVDIKSTKLPFEGTAISASH